jgi:hypothetical protein
MSRKRVGVAAAVAVVLFAMSPAFQGYHVGRSIGDTNCTTRFVVQFCKDEHTRIVREQAAADAHECQAIAKEAEEGKRRLFGPENYYWHCLRPGKEGLVQKWEREYHDESARQQKEEQNEKAQKRAYLEAEAAALKRRAKRLTEEEEQLDRESKYSLGSEKSSESTHVTQEAEKKLEEAKEAS